MVSVKFKFTIKFIRREKGFKSEILTEQQCSGENIKLCLSNSDIEVHRGLNRSN